MPLLEKISDILNGEAPGNESATCFWVIYPLLLEPEVGYEQGDVIPHLGDRYGEVPDFTILPNSDHAWYLEAKAWNVSLREGDVRQSVNYAHQNGKRWVVLTNGQQWRLYDDHIPAPADDKLVAAASLSDTSRALEFLKAISKDSITRGGIEEFAIRSLVSSILDEQLVDESSQVIRHLLTHLRRQRGLTNRVVVHLQACRNVIPLAYDPR